MPAPVRAAFVQAHHADPPEADPLIGPDGPLVRGRRVDGQAMVVPDIDQVSGQGPDGVRPEASTVVSPVQEQVDAGVAVSRIVLLDVLDAADDPAIELDREAHAGIVGEPLVDGRIRVRRIPPPGDLGLGEDVTQDFAIRGTQRPKANLAALE